MNQTTAVNGSGNVIVQAQGSGINVQIGARPHLALVPYHLRGRAPRRLLEVLNGFVTHLPLVGREAELAGFKAWLGRPERIAVGGLVGDAGSGKSRLAIDLCAQAETDGWLAGFLTHAELDRFFDKQNSSEWEWDQPTLVVVDYAAAKASRLKQWLEELALNDRGGPRLRLLLVERHADSGIGWWKDVCSASSPGAAPGLADMVEEAPLVRLPGLDDIKQRQALVEAVRSAAAPLVKVPSPRVPDLLDLDSLIRDPNRIFLPLDLAMATVIAVQAGDYSLLKKSRPEMAFRLAGFERSRLRHFAIDHKVDPAVVEHMAALVTLAGSLPWDALAEQLEAEAKAENWPALPGGFDHSLLEVLQSGGAEAHPLQPDLIGGAFVLAVMEKKAPQRSGQMILRWYRAFPAVAGALIRLGQDFGDIPAGQPGLDWLGAVAGSIDTVEDLIALAKQIPHQTVSLREVAAALTGKIVDGLRQPRDPPLDDEASLASLDRFSAWLNNLSNRLSDLGHREKALAAIEEAVEILRALSAARPHAFTPALALSLNNRSLRLSDLGRREDALAAIEEAVAIRRSLSAVRSDAFTPDLAGSLNTLSNRLSALGRHEAALAAIKEAVGLYRSLSAAGSDAFTPALASSLTTLSNSLSDLGRREAALAAIKEAVEIRRALSAARPDAFTPDLATSLNNLANRWFDLGRREDALAAIKETVEIRRALSAGRSDAFTPDLAGSLNNLSVLLSALGHGEEALAAIEDAVDLYRSLSAVRPNAFTPALASSLNTLSICLSALGRREDALAAIEEAVEIRRALSAACPDVFTPGLARSLNNLSVCLSALGHGEAALMVIEEAVGLYRSLSAARPDAFIPDLARSLSVSADVLEANGDIATAIGRNQSAISALAPFFLALPPAFAGPMGAMVRVYCRRSKDVGCAPDADLLGPILEGFQRLQQEDKNGGDDGPGHGGV